MADFGVQGPEWDDFITHALPQLGSQGSLQKKRPKKLKEPEVIDSFKETKGRSTDDLREIVAETG